MQPILLLLLLLSLSLLPSPALGTSAPRYSLSQLHLHSAFESGGGGVDFAAAEASCREEGREIVSVRNAEENGIVREASMGLPVWIEVDGEYGNWDPEWNYISAPFDIMWDDVYGNAYGSGFWYKVEAPFCQVGCSATHPKFGSFPVSFICVDLDSSSDDPPPSVCPCLALLLTDTYGDGWGPDTFTLSSSDDDESGATTPLFTSTLSVGYSNADILPTPPLLCLPPGCYVATLTVLSGFGSEERWSLAPYPSQYGGGWGPDRAIWDDGNAKATSRGDAETPDVAFCVEGGTGGGDGGGVVEGECLSTSGGGGGDGGGGGGGGGGVDSVALSVIFPVVFVAASVAAFVKRRSEMLRARVSPKSEAGTAAEQHHALRRMSTRAATGGVFEPTKVHVMPPEFDFATHHPQYSAGTVSVGASQYEPYGIETRNPRGPGNKFQLAEGVAVYLPFKFGEGMMNDNGRR